MAVVAYSNVAFGLYTYFTYGDIVARDPFITQAITSNNDVFMMIVKVLFCVNMVFSYRLIIFAADIIMSLTFR